MKLVINDGGRAAAGYKGDAGDCVCRAIAIATGLPYQEVYEALAQVTYHHAHTRRDKTARSIKARGGYSARNGVPRKIYDAYLAKLGWVFTPTMTIGSGCTVHLRKGELPAGRLIVRCSRHLTTVIDGVIHDTFDPSRNGTRCVYGYYSKTET
jgi:hypothetical protein